MEFPKQTKMNMIQMKKKIKKKKMMYSKPIDNHLK